MHASPVRAARWTAVEGALILLPISWYLTTQLLVVYLDRDGAGRLWTAGAAFLCLSAGVVIARGVVRIEPALARLGAAVLAGVALVFMAMLLGL